MSNYIRVAMAESGVGKAGDTLFTVVGSCIAIMLYDKKVQVGGIVHIMLSNSRGKTDNPSKYVDTAIPYLIRTMELAGAQRSRLLGAKLAGGAEMFQMSDAMNVSKKNIQATYSTLTQYNIQVIREDFGGTHGRRVSFDVATGQVQVQVPGNTPILL